MQYIEFKRYLKGYTIFSLADIRSIGAKFHRRRLSDWQDKGYIKKIIKGYYIFSDLELNENVIFEISNKIYSPSYVSLEAALAYYGLIPESVYGITSVATRKTRIFKTAIAEFSYRTIRPRLFFGYNLVNYGDRLLKIAGPEKAVLDYFYYHPHLEEREDFAKLRINKEAFLKKIDRDRMGDFLKKFAQKTLARRVGFFLEFLRHA